MNSKFLFLRPTDKLEIQNVMSSLDSNKSIGPNNTHTKILKLLKNGFPIELAHIFNISFSTGVFLTILKVAKVAPAYIRKSKLVFSSFRRISLLPNIGKIIEKLMYNRVYKLFTKKKVIYQLKFGFRQEYSTFHTLINLTKDITKKLD